MSTVTSPAPACASSCSAKPPKRAPASRPDRAFVTSSTRIEIVEPADLPSLAAEWWALWRGTPDATPFQSPAWILSWIASHAPGRCRAAALWTNGRLDGLLPIFCWDGAMLLAGTGPSDHGGLLLRPGCEEWAAALLATAAEACAGETDRIDLQQVAPDSPFLSCPPPPGWSSRVEAGEPCLLLPLAGADGMDAVPKRMRANWRYALRRADREGARLDLVQAEQAAEAAVSLERLHGLRWSRRGESGILADPLMARLLREAIPALAEAGLLRMHRLSVGGRAIALLLAMRGGRRGFYYLSGFDPAFERLSPGMVLVGTAIAHAASEGAGTFDFLRGREAYKYRWGAADAPAVRRILSRP